MPGIIYSDGCSINNVIGIGVYSADYAIEIAQSAGRGPTVTAECASLKLPENGNAA